MGFRVRSPRLKIGKGMYIRFGKNGASFTRRTKYVTQTTNLSTGKVRTTVKTPIKGVSYVEESGFNPKNPKTATVQTPKSRAVLKVCGIIMSIIGGIISLLSLLTFFAGGWTLLILSIPMLLLGIVWIKKAKST